ncbi:hypothetical protein EE612_059416 [Oryza sativa]|nr:hypothetical protein EE612_059416 [Oryza sativa]
MPTLLFLSLSGGSNSKRRRHPGPHAFLIAACVPPPRTCSSSPQPLLGRHGGRPRTRSSLPRALLLPDAALDLRRQGVDAVLGVHGQVTSERRQRRPVGVVGDQPHRRLHEGRRARMQALVAFKGRTYVVNTYNVTGYKPFPGRRVDAHRVQRHRPRRRREHLHREGVALRQAAAASRDGDVEPHLAGRVHGHRRPSCLSSYSNCNPPAHLRRSMQ